jgi:hypothetical protein
MTRPDFLKNVVPQDDSDSEPLEAQVRSYLPYDATRYDWIGPPHVGDDLDTLAVAERQYGSHTGLQPRVVAFARILKFGQVGKGHSPLCQTFEDQIVEVATFGQFYGWLKAIS